MELQGNCGGDCCPSPALRRWTLDEGERCSYIFWVLTLSCPSARHNWHNSCQDFVPAGNRGREQGQLEEEPAGSRFCSPTATLPANLLYLTWDIPYIQTSTSNPNMFISSSPPKTLPLLHVVSQSSTRISLIYSLKLSGKESLATPGKYEH